MYEPYFQLRQRPFAYTPQADLYFPAAPIEQAHHTLARCIERGEGPALLVGAPGTGKSLVCQLLAERFHATFHVAMLNSAQLGTRRALLQHLLFCLGLPCRGLDEGELRLSLLEFLQPGAARQDVLMIVDEAHTLPIRLFEDLRMITNIADSGQPRVRLVLAGSALLDERFAHPKLECFNQRLAARCYLQPLNYDETCAYVRSQIAKVGASPDAVFASDAWQAIYHASDGVPRLINQVCDRALLLACQAEQRTVGGRLIEEAWADLQQLPAPWQPPDKAAAAGPSVVEFGALEPLATQHNPPAPEAQTESDCEAELQSPAEPEPQHELQAEHGFEPAALPEPPAENWDGPLPEDVLERLEDLQRLVRQCEDEPHARSAASATFAAALGHAPRPAASPNPQGPAAPVARPSSDPFAEPFDQEELVVDHYGMLQAAAAELGGAAAGLQRCEIMAAMQDIFQQPRQHPAPAGTGSRTEAEPKSAPAALETDHSEANPTEPDTPPDSPLEAIAEQADGCELETEAELDANLELDADLELQAGLEPDAESEADAKSETETPAAELDAQGHGLIRLEREEGSHRAQVLRTPPDDNDMIVIVDDQHGQIPLRSGAGMAHRQEYRQLFSRLRQT